MSERSRPFLPTTQEAPELDLQRAIHETRPPVLPQFAQSAPMVRSRLNRSQRILGAAALALGGLVGREAIQRDGQVDTTVQEEFGNTGMSEDELVRTAAARRRVRVWQSYIKQLDAGERLPTSIDPEDPEGTERTWRRSQQAETDLFTEIGPEYRDEVMRRARKAALMLVLGSETPKTHAEVIRAVDRAIDLVVQGATTLARDHGWKGLNIMRADSLAMQVISKELRLSVDEHPEVQARLFTPLFEGLRERASEKRRLEETYPDSRRAGRDPVTGVIMPYALAETATLPETIFLDQFAWLGRVGGDEARLEYLRHDSMGVRILIDTGFLSWIEHSVPGIRQDASLKYRFTRELRRTIDYGDLTPEEEMRMRRLIRALES